MKSNCIFCYSVMPILGLIIVFLLLSACAGKWDEGVAAKLANTIAQHQNVPCIAVVYPQGDGQPFSQEVFRTVKSLQHEFRITKAMPFPYPGGFADWRDCALVLYVLLAWLPNDKEQFPQVCFISEHLAWGFSSLEGTKFPGKFDGRCFIT